MLYDIVKVTIKYNFLLGYNSNTRPHSMSNSQLTLLFLISFCVDFLGE